MIVAAIMPHRCSDVKGQKAVSFSQNGGIFTACIVSRAQRDRVALSLSTVSLPAYAATYDSVVIVGVYDKETVRRFMARLE
jgi:hypothetical protein